MLGQIILAYLFIVNAAGLILMLVDKQKAKLHRYRIPEATLMTVAAIGGSIGSLAGMYLFHHKTRKPKFYLGIPFFLIIHILIWLYTAPLLG